MSRLRRLLLLGIESSCDDSCASIVSSERRILSNIRLSQNQIHKPFEGIHPYHAIHAHQINLPIAIGKALQQADLKLTDLHGIAYTRGPGIAGCLAVGATAAKTLSISTGIPLIAVHHMQAHALTPLLTSDQPIRFPFLSLLVSGGHTMLVLVNSTNEFKILANTADKPIGLAIDKISRALDIPWPEGPISPGSALEKFVQQSHSEVKIEPLPVALRTGPSVFSFCGLQTATVRRLHPLSTVDEKRAIGKEFLNAAFAQLERKISYWFKQLDHLYLSGLVISGGVGSNLILRSRIKTLLETIDPKLQLYIPPVELCTDNAAMVAWLGLDKLNRGVLAGMDDPVLAKWSIEDAEEEGHHQNIPTTIS
ncbi:hypothetical protein PSTG_09252 [Puccinia striiformis f. sp. tritici PST-78]|uniref:N(6)-L-threonylcarbamoyladenine synthase n=1 Tax=Puccinia striiformis f. sp. tritici PST-78 TaxID=1165861 RepID=A0A0L0VEK8_9BASI|nr:hypothetical protein PSTG_09252 [Puccinia striiformis f. sp. tritici PST-78]